jgi:hypothetical protein
MPFTSGATHHIICQFKKYVFLHGKGLKNYVRTLTGLTLFHLAVVDIHP